MLTLENIAELIALPDEVKNKIKELEKDDVWKTVLSEELTEKFIWKLTECDEWESARENIKTAAAPDKDGFKMLYVMLLAACRSYDTYRQRKISDKIYVDTMKCFTRFIKEYRQIYGKYGFDRDFWTGRQTSLQLFRLGELEYEKTVVNGEKAISIHIPSDAFISRENCQASIKMARVFFKEHDEDYADVQYYCDSWLLSPALKKFLPDSSRIISFQNLFTIQSVDELEEGGIYWIFKCSGENPETLPEDTTLQREAKQYLLNGGKIGSGKGILKNSFR